ncbi:MAG TPA: hypothetical protein VFL16_10565 [Steroidobacteraceae bacterium]|nr:hypothetical protein [Steroidobacteraceae bacterium]HEX5161848.1 hypothetical protein [Steroidobacteraceae bacterium]
MKRWLRTIFALPVLCSAGADSAPRDFASLESLAARRECEYSGTAHRVVYAGPSEDLESCLERLGRKDAAVDELRITSGGGDAWVTLQSALALRGRLDLLVVDGLCASSCADYLLPAAKRVRIEPHSYVLLHGSLSQRDATRQHDAIRKSMREQVKAGPKAADLSEEEIEKIAQQAIDRLHADLTARIPVQEAFAREVLACDDWLDVWAHFGGHEPPAGTWWLLVTPEMAARCLRTAKLEGFWAPESQDAFDPQLGFYRARN